MPACSFSLKQEKKKKKIVRHEPYFPLAFSHFLLVNSEFNPLPQSGRASRRASGHSVSCPAERTHGCTPRGVRAAAPQAGRSAERGKLQAVWCQAEEPSAMALFFPRWVRPTAGYLLSTDLPLMLTKRAQREANQSLHRMLRVMIQPCNS